MMEPSRVLEDFLNKVQTVLQLSDVPLILLALRKLAEGKEAFLNDGQTDIQPLQGLGSQTSHPHQEYYIRAVEYLLAWFVRQLQFCEAPERDSLWNTLAILDGPNGYNQRLITTNGNFTADGIYIELIGEGGLCTFIPRPTILVPTEKKPLEMLNVNVDHINGYLLSGNAKCILVLQSFFGWSRLSIRCLCLYVEADEKTDLIELCSQQELPVILKTANFSSPAQDTAQAKEILEPAGINGIERNERKFMLRKNALPHRIPNRGNIRYGQSVSPLGQESKGSVGVFLSPSGAEEKIYALTAYHVLPTHQINERRVITPAELDILSSHLYWATNDDSPNNEHIAALLGQRANPCGAVEYGNFGSNANEWRTDFALVNLHDGFEGRNGMWHDYNGLQVLCAATENYQFAFHGTNGILGARDPTAGEICYKDGATTELTRGRIGLSEAWMFENEAVGMDTQGSTEISKAKLLTFHLINPGDGPVCAEGDSGCALFVSVPEMEGWAWVGQLVGLMGCDGGCAVGLVIPASQILESLKEHTGHSWSLTP